jgi:predicted RNA methylase
MYSVYGDTVLDPFWGTGTTSLAAMVAGRNSVGYEIDGEFRRVFADALEDVGALSRDVVGTRLDRHEAFVAERRSAGEPFEYEATHYDFPVTTKQERRIRLYAVESIEETENGYVASHAPVDR